MPELRRDPINGRWVIIAKERALRPQDFNVETAHPQDKFCPFCYGNEQSTPLEITAYSDNPKRRPNTIGWNVRVVPNKFPALKIEGELNRKGIGLFDMMNGIGAHEVVIETPNHNEHISQYSVDRMKLILQIYKNRLIDLKNDIRFRYIMIFKNYGLAAGASLFHSHSQIIALPVTPKRAKEELTIAKEYFLRKERCIFCDIINQELLSDERIVYIDDFFVALTPFAPLFPFVIKIFPRKHSHDFIDMNAEEEYALSKVLLLMLKKIKKLLGDPPFNYILHTTPNAESPRPGHNEYWNTIQYDYHWHIEIMPRLTKVAGFEWGTGFYINPVSPEDSTKFLKETEVEL